MKELFATREAQKEEAKAARALLAEVKGCVNALAKAVETGGGDPLVASVAYASERSRAAKWGITDLDRKYDLVELASGDVMFAATGVTDGTILRGVRLKAGSAQTESIIMRSKTGTVRIISAQHNLHRKPMGFANSK